MIRVTPARPPLPRHEWLNKFCSYIDGIILGRDASEVTVPDMNVAVTALPTWAYLRSNVNVGLKGKSNSIPARINWHGPHLIAHDEPVERSWSIEGLGHSLSGTTIVTPGLAPPVYGDPILPVEVFSPLLLPEDAQEEVDQVVVAGHVDYWEALMMLEDPVMQALDEARTAISAEVHDLEFNDQDRIPLVVDNTTLQGLRDEMLVMPGRNTSQSAVERIIEKALLPETFKRVEPGKYISTALRRDARTVIRSKITDPHAGSRVRKLARYLGTNDPEVLLQECRVRFPTTRISLDGIKRSLTTGPEVTASALVLDTTGDRVLDPEAGMNR